MQKNHGKSNGFRKMIRGEGWKSCFVKHPNANFFTLISQSLYVFIGKIYYA